MAAHRVTLLALDGVLSFELGMPLTIFQSLDGLYDLSVVTPTQAGVTTDSGLQLSGAGTLTDLMKADTVIVPAYAFEKGLPPRVADALRNCLERSKRVVSLCVGAFALAQSGLLAQRRATTHWVQSERLAQEHPDVIVDRDVLFVDQGTVLTSAGTSAGIDLCLHLVRKDHGAAVANQAARNAVAAPHRDGGQAQFIKHHLPAARGVTTAATRAWALERIAEPLALRDIAAHGHMSQRTFIRHFVAETGMPPMRWLSMARIDHAKQLLEQTDVPIEEIARRSGLGTAANFRARFAQHCGLSPSAYRRVYALRP
ncbi:transcriptional regulator GlxA family with amidase domain [Streptomyces aurantiacus]|uniref:GlxA family transcriptional regulator n=1 Tax=Streptomyces aurantiacus TaxID=47760 RepID=UPI00278DDE3F|nr:helix-turn-helix domain-containing protein [Streptomyces aurantiacus]MDQ0774225.1 transcriptional regulator GlxA family with amidase domain [Streptomyces aurantiacus]